MGCKTISFQNNFRCRYDLLGKTSSNWSATDYVSFVFEEDWKIGIITNVIEEQLKAQISMLNLVEKIVYYIIAGEND